ncbi:MAG TPA: glycosyltransferase family 39 protein [Candidatus Angelobacter sp.]|nr:glycosyltransferase family 39 protein [Candidatus Angelobacter sp.]
MEKPVLLYWKVMGSYRILGVYDWVARVPSAFYATGLVLAVFFFMRRFRQGSELDAALITASCFAVIGFGRGASTDMLLSAPFGVAMLAWWAWHQTGRKLWLAAFYALLAVGALAKGPVAAALAVLIVGAYAILRRDGKIFLRSLWWPGFLLFFAIALPWYVALQIKVPQFFRFFFYEQNLQRFGTNRYQHSQPFWYYIPVFLLSVFPWVVFTVTAIVAAGKSAMAKLRGQRPSEPSNETGEDWLPVFLLLWMAIPIIFFSISRSKLPGYILPAIPAAALLTANYLHSRPEAINRLRLILHSLLCGVLVGASLYAPWRMLKQSPPSRVVVGMAIATTATALAVFLIVHRGGLRVLRSATLLPMVLCLGLLLRPGSHVIDDVNSSRAVDARLNQLGVPPGPIAVFNVKREVEYGLNFYRNAPVSRYERDGVPKESHLVVAREDSAAELRSRVGQRPIWELGSFPPQHLEFFVVSSAR